ncbi:MAG: tRNA pseudouridine(38-40) synthase TruA [Candidatus Firestonebacteria bacterium]
MRNIKLVIEYDGTDYSGWQRIPGKKTIQGTIEAALSKILNEDIKITGASRTDAGVHALGQVANFKTDNLLRDLFSLRKSLNSVLPPDIVIKKISKVDLKFHARYSAKLKHYRYEILNSKIPSVISRRFSLFFSQELNLSSMRKTVKFLKGKHSFEKFCVKDDKVNFKITLKEVKIRQLKDFIYIDFYSKSFLRKMVRMLIGFLLNVGIEKYKPNNVKLIFKGKFKFSPVVAPARGLFLMEIKY